MYEQESRRPYRTVGRPLYATLSTFPVICFVLTLFTDLAYWKTASYLWETFSVWLLTLGLVGAGLAIVAGIVDFARSFKVRGLGTPAVRVIGHLVAFALALVNVFVHSRDGYTAVVPQGLILSALTVLVLLATSVAGGRATVRQVAAGGVA